MNEPNDFTGLDGLFVEEEFIPTGTETPPATPPAEGTAPATPADTEPATPPTSDPETPPTAKGGSSEKDETEPGKGASVFSTFASSEFSHVFPDGVKEDLTREEMTKALNTYYEQKAQAALEQKYGVKEWEQIKRNSQGIGLNDQKKIDAYNALSRLPIAPTEDSDEARDAAVSNQVMVVKAKMVADGIKDQSIINAAVDKFKADGVLEAKAREYQPTLEKVATDIEQAKIKAEEAVREEAKQKFEANKKSVETILSTNKINGMEISSAESKALLEFMYDEKYPIKMADGTMRYVSGARRAQEQIKNNVEAQLTLMYQMMKGVGAIMSKGEQNVGSRLEEALSKQYTGVSGGKTEKVKVEQLLSDLEEEELEIAL
jgi:hypothetical protein